MYVCNPKLVHNVPHNTTIIMSFQYCLKKKKKRKFHHSAIWEYLKCSLIKTKYPQSKHRYL